MFRRQRRYSAILGAVLAAGALSSAGYASSREKNATAESFSFSTVEGAYEYATDKGYPDSAQLLSDGQVTEDEYRYAESNYRRCFEAQGYEFGPVVMDPVSGLRLIYEGGARYTGPEGGANGEQVDLCQDAQSPVEDSFVLTRPQRMDPALLTAVQQCLDGVGATYDPAATNVKTLAGESLSPSPELVKCVTGESLRLFPALGVGIGY